MVEVLRSGMWTGAGTISIDEEGAPHGAPVSIILEDAPAGHGPRLHRHPYPEVWVVQAGRGRFASDAGEIDVGAGDIVYAAAGEAHKFTAIGPDRLVMVCIHCHDRFVTEWLEPKPQ